MWDAARTAWDTTALLLLEAFQHYSDSLCSSCGQSAFHALDVANTREYGVDNVTCLGCEVIARHHENRKDERKVLGEKTYVVNKMGGGV